MESEIKKYGCFVKGVEQKYPNVAPGTPIYANAVVVDNIVYVSGMTAQKFEDGSCTTNTMQDQMWVALSKMKQVLEEAGSCLENVFKTFIMLKDIKDYPVMRATELKFYQEYAPELMAPACKTCFYRRNYEKLCHRRVWLCGLSCGQSHSAAGSVGPYRCVQRYWAAALQPHADDLLRLRETGTGWGISLWRNGRNPTEAVPGALF